MKLSFKSLRWLFVPLAILVLPIAVLAACQRSLIYHPTSEIVAPDMAGIEALRIETKDGESLVAWYQPPPQNAAGERGPIFLFFDGNGGRPHIATGRWRRIAEGGAGFLAVYYRGYAGSTGRPTEAGLHEDARAGYDWLIAHGYRPDEIVIHGFSLGSGVAVRLASERPARALILEAPFTGIDDVVHDTYSPILKPFVSETFRSRDYIARVHMPVLIAHGDHDSVIPFAQGENLFARAVEPKTFVRMHGSDHSTLVRDGLYPHIWTFLAAHLAEPHDGV